MRTDKRGPRPGGDAAVKSRAPEEVGTPIVRTPRRKSATKLVRLPDKNNIESYLQLLSALRRLMRSKRKSMVSEAGISASQIIYYFMKWPEVEGKVDVNVVMIMLDMGCSEVV